MGHFATCTPTHVSQLLSVRIKIVKMIRASVARTLMGVVKTMENSPSAPGRIVGFSGHKDCKYGLLEGTRNLHTTSKLNKEHDRKDMIRSAPARDDGALGESTKDIDAPIREGC